MACGRLIGRFSKTHPSGCLSLGLAASHHPSCRESALAHCDAILALDSLIVTSLWCHNDTMDLGSYVEAVERQLLDTAEAGGDDARALAQRLVGPLDAAMRLALQDVLAAAAEEITTELAPGSVELRLRGRNLDLVVTSPESLDQGPDNGPVRVTSEPWSIAVDEGEIPPSEAGDDAAVARINLRLPDRLKARIERAASAEGLSVNSWLVRAATATLERTRPDHRDQRAPTGSQRYTGWAR